MQTFLLFYDTEHREIGEVPMGRYGDTITVPREAVMVRLVMIARDGTRWVEDYQVPTQAELDRSHERALLP